MIRSRSLISNSLTSIAASGVVILTTLTLPALLSRSITPTEYSLFATAMSLLPLLSILTQSLRAGAGSALLGVYRETDTSIANRAFTRFVVLIIFSVIVSGLICSEFYLHNIDNAESDILRFGIYSIIINIIGITLSISVTGPATAKNDFIPENILKIAPPMFQIIGFFGIYIFQNDNVIYYVFIVFAMSSWVSLLIILSLFARNRFTVRRERKTHRSSIANFHESASLFQKAYGFYGRPTASISWWNLTAFLSTTASVAIVAFFQPSKIASFSIAMSVIGVISGGLIAISSPIASKLASLRVDKLAIKREMFHKFNTLFIAYIVFSSLFVLIIPSVIFRFWVGEQYAEDVQYYVMLLLPAYCLRLLTMCFTIFIMSSGRQNTIWLSPAVEAVIATLGGFILIGYIGVAGIAIALLVSSAARLLFTLIHDINLNTDILPLTASDILLPRARIFFR